MSQTLSEFIRERSGGNAEGKPKLQYILCIDESNQNQAPFIEKGVIYLCEKHNQWDSNKGNHYSCIFIDGWKEPIRFDSCRFRPINMERSNYVILKKSELLQAMITLHEYTKKDPEKKEPTCEELSLEFENLTIHKEEK